MEMRDFTFNHLVWQKSFPITTPATRGPEHVHTSCHPSWEGHPLPAFEVVLGEEQLSSHQHVQCVEPDMLTGYVAGMTVYRPSRLDLHMLEKLTMAPIAAGFSFCLLVIPLPLNLFFKKATYVCFKEPICVLCYFVTVVRHGMIMRSEFPLAKELSEASGTINEAGLTCHALLSLLLLGEADTVGRVCCGTCSCSPGAWRSSLERFCADSSSFPVGACRSSDAQRC